MIFRATEAGAVYVQPCSAVSPTSASTSILQQALPCSCLGKIVSLSYRGEDNRGRALMGCSVSHARSPVPQASTDYYETQRRYNYVTPKSYLELIGFYKFLLDQKRTEVQRQIDRLDVGLSTLRKTAADVAELQVDLKHTMVKVSRNIDQATVS